jgi:pentatricopeptide repeat protein
MQMEGISPDKHVFMVAVQACAKIGEEGVVTVGRPSKSVALQIGKGLHADADRMGFSSDVLVASTLLNMYGNCGKLTEAEMLFETMSQPNEVTSFTAMISVYVEQGRGDKALQLFADRSKDIFLDDVIVICILKACTLTGSLEVCWQVHSGIVTTALCQSKSVTNTILHAYGCCASMADATVAMDELTQPDIVSWNSCIGSDGRNTMVNLLMFESMLLAGVEPEEITFLSVLSSLNHLGLVEKGIECFKSMPEKYGLIPNKKHYVAFVDLLGRAGNLAQLKDIISSHGPADSDVFCWIRLLSACDRHGDVELGEYIFDHVMHLQPDEAAAYVLMSNIYAYRTE